MAQAIEVPEQISVASGETDVFPTVFTFETAAEVVVMVDAGAGFVEKTQGVHYDLADGDWLNDGADCVFREGHRPLELSRVLRKRVTPIRQLEPFGDTARFLPQASEAAFDRLTRVAQDQSALLARAVVTQPGEEPPTPQQILDASNAGEAAAQAAADAAAALAQVDGKIDADAGNLSSGQKIEFKAAIGLASMAEQPAGAVAVTGGLIGGGTQVRAATVFNNPATPATPFELFAPPGEDGGTGFRAPHQFNHVEGTAHAGDGRSVVGIRHVGIGSGARGPANSNNAAFISVKKTNYADGEFNGLYFNIDHRGGGDSSAILGQVTRTGSDGAALGAEFSVRRRAALGTYAANGTVLTGTTGDGLLTHVGQVYLPHSEANEADFGSLIVLEGKVGRIREGLLFDTYDERAALGVLDTAETPQLLNFVRARRYRDNALEEWVVNGSFEHGMGLPADRIWLRYNVTDHILQWLNTAKSAGIASLDQVGNFSAATMVSAPVIKAGWFTKGTMPSASARQGAYVGCSNGASGGKCAAFSDGGSWFVVPLTTLIDAP